MAKKRRRKRSTSTIDQLPPDQKSKVEEMLVDGNTYKEVADYLISCGVSLSQSAIGNYAVRYLEMIEMLQLSQETFKMIAQETDKYPDIDTTEVIVRIASRQMLTAISKVKDDEWDDLDPKEIMKEANALIRAAAYKKRVDLQSKTELEKALEANKALLFETISKRRPDLYKQIVELLNEEKEALQEVDTP